MPAPTLRMLALALATAFAAVACQSQPFPSGATIDTEYDFASKNTWAFNMVPEKVLASENGKILRSAIDESLTARGMKQVDVSAADLWVSYDVGIYTASATSWGAQSALGKGRIVVRAIDPATRHEVWYGWAEASIRRDPDPERRIPAAVEALFENRVRPRQ